METVSNRLRNIASIYQSLTQTSFNDIHQISLGGAQKGLVMTVTPQDCIVHWPSSFATERTLLISYAEELPYQEGKELSNSTTEIMYSSGEERPSSKQQRIQGRKTIYMAIPSELLPIAPEIPDVRSSDESESNISQDEKSDSNESEEQRQARLKRNKLKNGRRTRAQQRKQAWTKYKAKLIEYKKKRIEKEAEKNATKEKIQGLTKELEALINKEREKEKVTNQKEAKNQDKQPDAATTRRPEEQQQRRSAFQRLKPVESSNMSKTRDRGQSHYPEQPKERTQTYQTNRHQDYSRRDEEGQGESEYREARSNYRRARTPDFERTESFDRFPCFAERLQAMKLPHMFKPSNHSKYDGKIEPKQWLRVYSQSIELAGGDDDIKTLFFPMALEALPLQWFDKLKPGFIKYWEDL